MVNKFDNTVSKLMHEMSEEYRGEHEAPMKDNGSPLHDLSGIYPEDIYSSNGARYYGHYGDSRDQEAISVIRSYRNHPSKPITIYRAVPYEPSKEEQINAVENEKKDFMKFGTRKYPRDHYDVLNKKLEALQNATIAVPKIEKINVGDWVTTVRSYAKEHGETTLNGKYKILSKKVSARDLYTDGNSIFEFGYDPS